MFQDTMNIILKSMMEETEKGSPFYEMLFNLEHHEKYNLITKLLDPYTENMFVTPKEVDSIIKHLFKRLSNIIANDIHIALYEGITTEDIGHFS